MTPQEAAGLLAMAAAFDNRKPDADAATAWALALDGLRFEDCREVVVDHYRNTRDWLMPSDVTTGVRRLRNERVTKAGPAPAPPPSVDPDDPEAYTRYVMGRQTAAANGELEAFEASLDRPEVTTRTIDVSQLMPRPPTHAEVANARRAIYEARESLCAHQLQADTCERCRKDRERDQRRADQEAAREQEEAS